MAGNSPGAGQQLGMMETSAMDILKRADELNGQGRYTDATVCYQEGLQLLMNVIKSITNEAKKSSLRAQFRGYICLAEKVKEQATNQQALGKHEQVRIENDSKGNSYDAVFGRFLDDDVTTVQVDDPYVRTVHQVYNFLRFCELLVKKCKNIKFIRLTTSMEKGNPGHMKKQKQCLDELTRSLQRNSVQMQIELSETLHDREIRLDNGWMIKIGRGLDYFKPPESAFAIGYCDQDLRLCYETIVDIFHYKHLILNGK